MPIYCTLQSVVALPRGAELLRRHHLLRASVLTRHLDARHASKLTGFSVNSADNSRRTAESENKWCFVRCGRAPFHTPGPGRAFMGYTSIMYTNKSCSTFKRNVHVMQCDLRVGKFKSFGSSYRVTSLFHLLILFLQAHQTMQ